MNPKPIDKPMAAVTNKATDVVTPYNLNLSLENITQQAANMPVACITIEAIREGSKVIFIPEVFRNGRMCVVHW